MLIASMGTRVVFACPSLVTMLSSHGWELLQTRDVKTGKSCTNFLFVKCICITLGTYYLGSFDTNYIIFRNVGICTQRNFFKSNIKNL